MENRDIDRLGEILRLAATYCTLVQDPEVEEREDYVLELLTILSKLYVEFLTYKPETDEEEDYALEQGLGTFFQEHADESLYNYVRSQMQQIMSPDDTYLETFEEDMKYSDTPIAATISESLADIFQPLYNFSEEARLSEGATLKEAYLQCREEFNEYWSQTLVNVLRPLNALLKQ